MWTKCLVRLACLVPCIVWAAARAVFPAEIIVAEGEKFKPRDDKGWKVVHQDDSWASHSYGGMWSTHGGLIGAPADSEGSVAVQKVVVPAAGEYRVWSKYQAPPYFNYLHKIEVVQKGKTVHSYVYGRDGAPRMWSFSAGVQNELWWVWGVDHDAAEAPKAMVRLDAGEAEVRLITVKGKAPAGDPMIDFVVLTTEPGDTYTGFKPYNTGSPFCREALKATELYVRFQNASDKPARLRLTKPLGHWQPDYGGTNFVVPAADVPPGQWSPWTNIGPSVTLVHDEGLVVDLAGAPRFKLEVARDAAGKDLAASLTLASGDTIVLPIDVTWNHKAEVTTSREHAQRLIDLARHKWRTANKGRKPKQILYYGAFSGGGWVDDLKDALGYNTLLPDRFEHAPVDGYHQHAHSPAEIQAFAARLEDKSKFKVLSFGDEIHIGSINFNDPAMQEQFVGWLKARGLVKKDVSVDPDQARLADRTTSRRIAWYAELFSNEQMFDHYRRMTDMARELIGPQVQTGANYSPHGMPQYYGSMAQWIDIFKYGGMTMFWTEDYIFSVAQPPQIISWMFATMRCATKYKGQDIHMYVMPHAPGQEPEYLRRNMVLSVGYGARHIDSFWVAPMERFTENFVSWTYPETFRVIHEAIFDSAEAEPLQVGGKVRPARVAIVLSRATDHNERNIKVDVAADQFLRRCTNAAAQGHIPQTICRKDQQMLYLALRHAQHAVDLITEDDIMDGALKGCQVVYFAGEWSDERIVPVLQKWVADGGVLYATAGLGWRNQFDEPYDGMLALLGLKGCTTVKDVYVLRPYLELPLAQPIDTITMGERKIPAIGMKQELAVKDATVLGTWSNGKPAVTERRLGKGRAFAVGTLAGNTYMKTGLRVVPWARGGRKMVYNPTDFDPAAAELALLGVRAAQVQEDAVCANPFVECIVLDNENGSLLTLVNWTNAPLKDIEVKVRMARKPRQVRSVQQQKEVASTYADGVLTMKLDLEWADYVLLPK